MDLDNDVLLENLLRSKNNSYEEQKKANVIPLYVSQNRKMK